MGRWVGMALILFGAAVGVWQWRKEHLERQGHLYAWIAFLRRASYAMEEKQRMTELFEEYRCEDALVMETLSKIRAYLGGNIFSSGEEAWDRALSDMGWKTLFTAEEMRLMRSLGHSFFGGNRAELGELMDITRAQLERCLAEEYARFAKNQRIVVPVGMLGGVLLILLLL